MKLTINADKCQGHGRCFALVPELFDLDDNGNGLVKRPKISGSEIEQAELAILNCPEKAISLGE